MSLSRSPSRTALAAGALLGMQMQDCTVGLKLNHQLHVQRRQTPVASPVNSPVASRTFQLDDQNLGDAAALDKIKVDLSDKKIDRPVQTIYRNGKRGSDSCSVALHCRACHAGKRVS